MNPLFANFPRWRISRIRFLRTIDRSRTGTNTIEMALVAPFVFMLVIGSFEFSRMMMVLEAMNNASREGCRHACLANTTASSQSTAVVLESLRGVVGSIESNSYIISTNFEPDFVSPPESGTQITTTVEISCEDVSWLPPFFFSGATLRQTTTMERE